jgi:hypothetical protein
MEHQMMVIIAYGCLGLLELGGEMEGELVYASFTGTNYDRFFLTLSDLGIAGSAKLVCLLCYLVLIGSFSACAKS